MKVVGLPDYKTDTEWLSALDDMIRLAGIDPASVVFYGGCDEDIRFFTDAKRNVKIINRFDGSTPKISATEVRDALIHGRPLDGLVNQTLQSKIRDLFTKKWEEFKRM